MTLCPGENQPAHDLIMTPPSLAKMIVRYYRPNGIVLDPARGSGAFYDAIQSAALSPMETRWCELADGRDFFQCRAAHDKCDWIITNPPWSKLRKYLLKSMELADHIVFLATLTHFVTRARLRDIKEHSFGLREALLVDQPPFPWPSSGFQLAAVHLQRSWTGDLKITDYQNKAQLSLAS